MIRRLLDDLARVGYLKLGKRSDDGRPVGWVVNFLIHQRIDRPKLSIIKEFWSFDDASTTPRRSIAGEGKGMEGKGKEPPPLPPGGAGAPILLPRPSEFCPPIPPALDVPENQFCQRTFKSSLTRQREQVSNKRCSPVVSSKPLVRARR